MTVERQPSANKAAFGVPSAFVCATRLLPNYRWWKPILALLLAAVFAIAFGVAIVLGFMVVQMAIDPQTLIDDLNHGKVLGMSDDGSYLGIELTNAFSLSMLLLSAAVMLPAAGLAALITGLGGFRTISSVEGRLRLDVFKKLGPWVLGLSLVVLLIQMTPDLIANPNSLGAMTVAPAALLAIVFLTPLQCAAEEYLFRGLIMQVLGSWIPIAIIPVILQAIAFASMHTYNIWGVLDIFASGVCFGLLAAKTGGLEAGILLHSLNNIFSLMVGSLFASQVVQSDATVAGAAIDAITTIAMTAVILWIAKRKGLLVDDSQFEQKMRAMKAAQVARVSDVQVVQAAAAQGIQDAHLFQDFQPERPSKAASAAVAKYCYECGTSLREGANFCTRCGTPAYKAPSNRSDLA